MKLKNQFLFVVATGIVFSCGQSKTEEKSEHLTQEKAVEVEVVVEEKAQESINVEELVSSIDAKRAEIEGNLGEPIVMTTENMRAKTKQKWQTIHFYTQNDEVVRIKTYPYAEISKRTEEYYVEGGKLILAVIEDNGEGEKGKPKDQLDKLYYFQDDKVVSEFHSENESEYSVREGDGEELLAEFKEYMEAFNNNK